MDDLHGLDSSSSSSTSTLLHSITPLTQQLGLRHLTQLLHASIHNVSATEVGRENPFALAVLGIWRAVLLVGDCVEHGHCMAGEAAGSAQVGHDGRVSWPVIEATTLICQELPHRAATHFASWQLDRHLAVWTSEARALAH